MSRKTTFLVVSFYSGIGLLHFILYKMANLPFSLSVDHVEYTYPVLSVMRNSLLRGNIPAWFSEAFSGMPLLFLGSIDLKALLFLRYFDVLDTMVLLLSIFMVFGGVMYFIMIRSLFKFSVLASLYGGLFWILNGFITCWGYDTPYTTTTYWIPALIWAVLRFEQRPLISGALLLLGFTDVIMVGRPDALELALYAVFAFSAVYTLNQNESLAFRLRDLFKRGSLMFFFFVGALILCFPFLRQQFELLQNSGRFHEYQVGETYHSTLVNFFNIVPNSAMFFWFRDGIGNRAYIGLFNLFLILLCTIRPKNQRPYLPYLVAAVVTCLFMYDLQLFWVFNLWRDVYKALPKHEGIRYSIRFLPTFFLFISVPLCAGFELICDRANEFIQKPRVWNWLSFCMLFLAVLILFLIPFRHQMIAQALAALLSLNLGLFALLRLWRIKPASWFVALSTVLIVSTYLANFMMTGERPLKRFEELHSDAAKFEYVSALKDFEKYNYRVMYLGDVLLGINEFLIAQGLHSISGYQPMVSGDIVSFYSANLEAHVYIRIEPNKIFLPRYDFANVRFWFVDPSVSPELKAQLIANPGIKLFKRFPASGMEIYESSSVLPRVQLVRRFELVSHEATFRTVNQRVEQNAKWFEDGVILTAPVDNDKFVMNPEGNVGNAKIVEYRNSYVKIQANTESGGILVFRDHFDRRWSVSVDGVQAPMYQADLLFRAVYLRPGEHTVEFFYHLLGPWPS